MNAREHVMIGTISATAALFAARSLNLIQVGNSEIIIGISIAAISSLIPDIDEPNSTISRSSFWMMALGLLLVFIPPLTWLPGTIAPGTMKWLLLLQGSSGAPIQQIIGFLLLGFALIAVINGRLLDHRGITHSLFCLAVTSWAIWATYVAIESSHALLFAACFALGYLSHLVADATTKEGLPDLLFPLSEERIEYLREAIDDLILDIKFRIGLM